MGSDGIHGSSGRQPVGGRRPAAGGTGKRGASRWRLCNAGAANAIEGYASAVSVLPGSHFSLYVSTTADSFWVQAFRMGWYGGSQAREVWQSGTIRGRAQVSAKLVGPVRMVTAPWRPALVVTTKGWPPGAYLLRLTASSGAQRYVPLMVRSPQTAGRLVLLEGVTTWEAYNQWGGYSLYDGPQGFGDRSYAVSFDRPYPGSGADLFLSFDQPPIALAESTGLPLAFETDVDIDEHPRLLRGARAVISLGHDEYYSAAMRRAVFAARASGTNVAFLGANAMYRHIRFVGSSLGRDRVEVGYKVARLDPEYGHNNAATTQNWRDPPDPRPESRMTGVMYECEPVSSAYVVDDAANWLFAGTEVRTGAAFPGLVGPEYDRVNLAAPFPRPMEILSHSPVTCDGHASYADSVYYTVSSGAGVFASGTMRWVCAMRGSVCGHGVDATAQRFVDRVTENLLRAFAAGPAARTHRALDNVAHVRPLRGSAFEGY